MKKNNFNAENTTIFTDAPTLTIPDTKFYLYVVKKCCVGKRQETVETLAEKMWVFRYGKISFMKPHSKTKNAVSEFLEKQLDNRTIPNPSPKISSPPLNVEVKLIKK